MALQATSRLCSSLWIGGLLIVFSPFIASSNPMSCDGMYWLGAGFFIDDLPDVPPRMREVSKG
ncbi:MAG: hypothetical protein OEZ48_02795 [Candidatus Bathyarchaeota archaeon]|nr:hypothetical protein [Candidatus Bathyarchaeota archaeon]